MDLVMTVAATARTAEPGRVHVTGKFGAVYFALHPESALGRSIRKLSTKYDHFCAGGNDGGREHTRSITSPNPRRAPSPANRCGVACALSGRPDGVEGLLLDGDGRLYIVTKGRTEPVTLYSYPAPLRPDSLVTLERMRELLPRPARPADYVTAATTTLPPL